jgi:hypothetical protein
MNTDESKVETQENAKTEVPPKVRKSPTPKVVKCNHCGKEAFSQSFKVAVEADGTRLYVCRRKGGCTPSETKLAAVSE